MPVNAQIGNISYVLCAIVGGILALGGYGGFTLRKARKGFLTYNKSFGQPINQLSMQLNNIVMALAGSERIFALLDEQPEVDDGYVTLVRARVGKRSDCGIQRAYGYVGMEAHPSRQTAVSIILN